MVARTAVPDQDCESDPDFGLTQAADGDEGAPAQRYDGGEGGDGGDDDDDGVDSSPRLDEASDMASRSDERALRQRSRFAAGSWEAQRPCTAPHLCLLLPLPDTPCYYSSLRCFTPAPRTYPSSKQYCHCKSWKT